MRPEDLARKLGVSGKTVRAWLREQYPRGEAKKHKAWRLTAAQERAVRARFSARTQRAPSREEMVVTTVAIPESIHRQLLATAREERMVMTELVRQAVREWLVRRGYIKAPRGRAR